MEVQSKAIKSIQSDTLIYNYPVRNRENKELRHLKIAMNSRRIEMAEKLNRIEAALKEKESKNRVQEMVEETDFSNNVENYIMNRV